MHNFVDTVLPNHCHREPLEETGKVVKLRPFARLKSPVSV